MKSIWKGFISFGLVNIPVKMYSGSQSNTLDLDMLRKGDLCKVQYKRVCADDGKEIPFKDIVKGYKYKGGGYVVLNDKDFEKANVEKTQTIEIFNFVDEDEINPIYYEKPYYLEPEKSAAKPYALLAEAITKAGKVGIGRFVMKNREHIAALKPDKGMLILEQLRFQNEIRSREGIFIPSEKNINKKEVELAQSLIKRLSGKFDPKKYKDTYIDELKKIIEQKAKGKKIMAVGKAPKATNVKNLMTLLKKSIEKKAA